MANLNTHSKKNWMQIPFTIFHLFFCWAILTKTTRKRYDRTKVDVYLKQHKIKYRQKRSHSVYDDSMREFSGLFEVWADKCKPIGTLSGLQKITGIPYGTILNWEMRETAYRITDFEDIFWRTRTLGEPQWIRMDNRKSCHWISSWIASRVCRQQQVFIAVGCLSNAQDTKYQEICWRQRHLSYSLLHQGKLINGSHLIFESSEVSNLEPMPYLAAWMLSDQMGMMHLLIGSLPWSF